VESVRGLLGGKSVAVIHTGVGPKVSQERMEVILRREKFTYLISAGFAGALETELRVGNVLVAENYSAADLVASPRLQLDDEGTFLGKLLTVPRMVELQGEREDLAKRTGAIAVDMETEIIATTCAAHELPMLSVRAISDTASAPFPAPAVVLFDVARQKTNFLRLASYLVTHPSAFGRLNAFRQQIEVARKALTVTLQKIVTADLM
jgi:purine-nucleoside phosphorylase